MYNIYFALLQQARASSQINESRVLLHKMQRFHPSALTGGLMSILQSTESKWQPYQVREMKLVCYVLLSFVLP